MPQRSTASNRRSGSNTFVRARQGSGLDIQEERSVGVRIIRIAFTRTILEPLELEPASTSSPPRIVSSGPRVNLEGCGGEEIEASSRTTRGTNLSTFSAWGAHGRRRAAPSLGPKRPIERNSHPRHGPKRCTSSTSKRRWTSDALVELFPTMRVAAVRPRSDGRPSRTALGSGPESLRDTSTAASACARKPDVWPGLRNDADHVAGMRCGRRTGTAGTLWVGERPFRDPLQPLSRHYDAR